MEVDEEWMEAVAALNVVGEMKIITQPPNSPDTNLNDLGFFAALQSRCYRENPNNSFETVEMVEKAFDEFDGVTRTYR
jgi:hypothetical protein